jgi:hypothetical protein
MTPMYAALVAFWTNLSFIDLGIIFQAASTDDIYINFCQLCNIHIYVLYDRKIFYNSK